MTAGQLTLSLAVLVLATLSAALLVAIRSQSRMIAGLAESVDRLSHQAAPPSAAAAAIEASRPTTALEPVPSQVQLPAAQHSAVTALLGVPLLKLAALSYAVRRSLDAEHRRRLARVVDQELRAARRRRRTARMGTRRTAARSR